MARTPDIHAEEGRGNSCDHLHPEICPDSLSKYMCLDINCKLTHLKTTKRYLVRPGPTDNRSHTDLQEPRSPSRPPPTRPANTMNAWRFPPSNQQTETDTNFLFRICQHVKNDMKQDMNSMKTELSQLNSQLQLMTQQAKFLTPYSAETLAPPAQHMITNQMPNIPQFQTMNYQLAAPYPTIPQNLPNYSC